MLTFMERFQLQGFYKYVNAPTGKGKLTGEIEVNDKGAFEGEIHDHASMSPNQILKVHLKKDELSDRLLFLKFPQNIFLANLAYALRKPSNGSFEGKYSGEWKALPFKVEFNPDYGLFIASVDMSVAGIGDKAQINLYRM